MTTERVQLLCELHIGAKIRNMLKNAPDVFCEDVTNDIHEDDSLIVEYANGHNLTIITRDDDFPNRRLCSIDRGVLYIPQRDSGRRLKPEECLDCLRRLIRSGRLKALGHGVCTVYPDRIELRFRTGVETYNRTDI